MLYSRTDKLISEFKAYFVRNKTDLLYAIRKSSFSTLVVMPSLKQEY